MQQSNDYLTTLIQVTTAVVAITAGFTAAKLTSLAETRNSLGRRKRDLFLEWERAGASPHLQRAEEEVRAQLVDQMDDIRKEMSFYQSEQEFAFTFLVPLLGFPSVTCVIFPLSWMVENIQVSGTIEGMLAGIFGGCLLLSIILLVRTGSSIYD